MELAWKTPKALLKPGVIGQDETIQGADGQGTGKQQLTKKRISKGVPFSKEMSENWQAFRSGYLTDSQVDVLFEVAFSKWWEQVMHTAEGSR